MRRIDADAIERRGMPAAILMETAGRAVAAALRLRWPAVRRPLVLCGPGNNGGDGLVAARVLAEWDAAIEPLAVIAGSPERYAADARACFERAAARLGEPRQVRDAKELEPLLARADLVVDALFGVGLARPVAEPALGLLQACAASGLPVLAVDVPSGVSSDSGEPLGFALPASLVVALGLPKLGLALQPEPPEIWVADIGLPGASIEAAGVRQHAISAESALALLPARPAAANKGTFGHVLIAVGSPGKTGAGALSARAAIHSGAGLVTVAAPRSLQQIYAVKLDEAMTLPLEDEGRGVLGAAAVEALLREAAARDALVIGPGIGTDPATRAAVRAVLEQFAGPAVVDADALNACAGEPAALRGAGPRVLTPHPGEAARLLGCETAAVQADRTGSARRIAAASGAVVVLKGARTLVCTPAGEIHVNTSGGPGLATGGTGDVLAGVIGALLAQGLEPLDAARAGVFLHGRAGEHARLGTPAGAIAARVPEEWRRLQAAAADGGDGGEHADPARDWLCRFP